MVDLVVNCIEGEVVFNCFAFYLEVLSKSNLTAGAVLDKLGLTYSIDLSRKNGVYFL